MRSKLFVKSILLKLGVCAALISVIGCTQSTSDSSSSELQDSIQSNLDQAVAFIRASDYENARIKLSKVDSLTKLTKAELSVSSMLANYAWIFQRNYEYDSAIFYYKKSLSIAEKARSIPVQINRYKSLGRVYRANGQFSKAVESLEIAKDFAEQTDDQSNIASASNALGNILSDLKEYERSMKYYRIATAIWGKDVSQLSTYSIALHNMATTLVDMDSTEKALPILHRALSIKSSLNRRTSMAYTFSALGTAYRKLDSLEKSREMFSRAYEIRDELDDRPGLGQVLLRIGELDILENKLLQAERNLKLSEDFANEIDNPELLREVLEAKKDLYKISNRLREWVATDEVFDVLTDSLQREQRLRVQEAQSKAELQREQQRTALAEQGAQIARLEAESERQKGELRLILIFVALLALAVIGWQLWQIRKRNSSLIALNNRIRLITDNAFHSQKNALGLISALLRSKARQSEHDKELEVLRDVEGKIEALGGVAKYLFQTRIADNTEVAARIQLASYLESLINDTFESVASDNGSLEMNLEEVSVSSTEALNIGLIANETVTNFSKYAASRGADKLKIETKAEVEKLLFQVSDNGPGFPEDFKISKSNGFGMQMIANLVEDMEGKLSMVREEGWTLIRIHIPLSH